MSSDEKKRGLTLFSDPARLIECVAQSPQLCAAHDRAGWVGLFARDGVVNDPVGSRPHQGREAIERFYDTFIAPNAIAFNVTRDIVCGMDVMRDLSIRTTLSGRIILDVPMHLHYELVEEDGALKIHGLYAHWELPVMMAQMMRMGLKGLWTSLQLTPRLLRHQGLGGLLGFMRGYFGIGRSAKPAVEALLAAARDGDEALARSHAATGVTLPQLRGVSWRKLIGAGNYVTATIELDGKPGVALFRFDEKPDRVSHIQVFI